MKQLLILLALFTASAVAQTTSNLASGGIGVSCNAVTSSTSNNPGTSGGCTSFNLLTSGSSMPSIITWQVTTTGSPSGLTVNLMGSLDNSTWTQIGTTSSAATNSVGPVAYRFIGCVPATLSGGTSPTVTCQVSTSGSQGQGVQYVSTAPSGTCVNGVLAQIVVSTGTMYTCQSLTWTSVGGGSGTVSANSGTAGAIARYSAAGGSTTVSASADVFDNNTGTQTIGAVGVGSGLTTYVGTTSGTGTIGCTNATCTTLTVTSPLFVGAAGVKAVAASGFVSEGTTFTSSAGCSETTLVGGSSAGKFASGTTGTCATTITMGSSATSPNGWVCTVYDLTTGIAGVQTGGNATTAAISVTTTSGNTVVFSCIGY